MGSSGFEPGNGYTDMSSIQRDGAAEVACIAYIDIHIYIVCAYVRRGIKRWVRTAAAVISKSKTFYFLKKGRNDKKRIKRLATQNLSTLPALRVEKR